MKKTMITCGLLLTLFLLTNCMESGTGMGHEEATIPEFTLQRQIPGCRGNGVSKMNSEECFSYEFSGDELTIEFCVDGNCCPDSNRFVMNSTCDGANIFIAVTDTAANLCHCICDYKVQTQFSNVTGSFYTVTCTQENTILYQETIVRSE